MDRALQVDVAERTASLGQEIDECRRVPPEVERIAFVRFIQDVCERPTVQILHREEGERSVDPGVVDPDDLGMIDLREKTEFAVEAGDLLKGTPGRFDPLEGEDLSRFGIVHSEDGADPAEAEFFQDFVSIRDRLHRGQTAFSESARRIHVCRTLRDVTYEEI